MADQPLPPLPPKWSCSGARDLIARTLSGDPPVDLATSAASGIIDDLVAAGWTLLPPGEWAAVHQEIAALAEALDAVTHEDEPGCGDPRCDSCGADVPDAFAEWMLASSVCGGRRSHPMHRTPAELEIR
jgi:hypothetical protein